MSSQACHCEVYSRLSYSRTTQYHRSEARRHFGSDPVPLLHCCSNDHMEEDLHRLLLRFPLNARLQNDRQPGGDEFELADSEYADDTAVLFEDRTEAEVGVPHIINHFARFGMEVHQGDRHPKKGSKSEVLFCSKPLRLYEDKRDTRQHRSVGH